MFLAMQMSRTRSSEAGGMREKWSVRGSRFHSRQRASAWTSVRPRSWFQSGWPFGIGRLLPGSLSGIEGCSGIELTRYRTELDVLDLCDPCGLEAMDSPARSEAHQLTIKAQPSTDGRRSQ